MQRGHREDQPSRIQARPPMWMDVFHWPSLWPLRLSSQGTSFMKHWCLGAGISSSTWSPYCGHRNTGTGCTSAERSRSSTRGFLSVESSMVWPSRFKSLFNPSLSSNLSSWDGIVSGPNWEAIHCFSYLKNPIPRPHTSERGTCSWRLLNFFKI